MHNGKKHWPASLEGVFSERLGRTVLSRLRFEGPLRVQRLFYPEAARDGLAEPCHCYLLHPPGGMADGDELRIHCTVEQGAHCLMTAPAAGKVYRALDWQDGQAVQSVRADVHDAVLEWLPQESILFDGARAAFSTRFDLTGRSKLIAWDMTCLGRQAAGEAFSRGRWLQSAEIRRDGLPLLRDRLDLEGGGELQASLAGLGGKAVVAAVYACGDAADDAALAQACERLQDWCEEQPLTADGPLRGVTFRGGVLIARWIGRDAVEAKRFCLKVWKVARPALLGREPCIPRIWRT